MHEVPLATITKNVMPSGFSAFVAKPDIPTWLVGSLEEPVLLEAPVPAPNEAHTQLLWPYDTGAFVLFLQATANEATAKRAAATLRSR
jgi:hypothetical protein